jgi:hypothetical protein
MEQIVPRRETFVVPKGTMDVVRGARQSETYEPLCALRTPAGKIVSQWLPTPEELRRLQAGEPITLIVHTYNTPLQPVVVGVGGFSLMEGERS